MGECKYDNGGYFIIKGKERALVSQERINYNIVHIFEQKINSKFLMVAEIRSMSEETGHSVLIQMKINNNIDKKVLLQIPYVSQEIPLGYIFKAYNFSIKDIIYILEFNLKNEYKNYPVLEIFVKNIIKEVEMIDTQENAIIYISQFSMHSLSKERKLYYINQILNNELFPHLGIMSTKYQKGMFLGHMLSKLLFTYVKKRSLDDRDHINNKRLEAAGHLVAELFRTLFKRFVRSMEPQIAKRQDVIVVMSRNNIITQGIKHCFSTGNWGIPKSNYIRTGVSQILSRLTYNSFLSHLRRVLIPIGKEGKNTKIRQLHPSQIGYICPFETPEGHCLTADTEILINDNITTIPIKNLKADVITVNIDDGTEAKSSIYNYFEIMPKELFRFTLINNQSIRASGLHPFLVLTSKDKIKWKKSKDICISDKMATRPILKKMENYPANSMIRLMGLLRALYQKENPNDIYIPQNLDFKLIIKDLKNYDQNFQIDESKHCIKNISLLNKLDLDNIIPLWINITGNIRDFLLGFFCGINYGGETFINQVFNIDKDNIYINGDYENKINVWKKLCHIMMDKFNLHFDQISFDQEKQYKCYIRNEKQNIINFIETFGFYYNKSIERDIFIYKDFLKLKNEMSFVDFMKDIRIFHNQIIFYPIQSIEKQEVELTMDFTTKHNNHTFIANGFITHNSAGIVKNLTMTTQLTTKYNNIFIRMVLEEIEDICMDFDFNNLEILGIKYYKIILDGNWIGYSINNIYDKLIEYKKNKRFSDYISISINHHEMEILIFTDEGRMIRPLFNAKNMPTLDELKNKSFTELCNNNKIILVDSYEMENNIVAMTFDELQKNNFYTLCELHPSLIVGLCVGLIPYSDHTQAPRITYHASMGKQAIGLYLTTNNIRSDTIVHILQYPEKPLVQTHMGLLSGCDDMVFGMNLIVAVAMYTGFNQEDSVIMNQSAIDRGLFRSYSFRTIHIEERKKSTTYSEDILLPPNELRIKSFNYSKLDKYGIVKCGIFVGANDVIVGKIQTKNSKLGIEEKIDTSVVIKIGEEGYIDRVFISNSPEGYKMVKVKIRSLKIPEIGDKVASRSAQKGTVGMVYRQEDMPFSSVTGMIPDIIINPLCLPSRMTINQIIETIASKCSAHEGKYRLGTPFTRHSTDVVESICQDLIKNGFSPNGRENLYNGFTGEPFQVQIFMGPTYYHRLKHLVSAKIHARNHGSLQALTRQPVEGRSRDGGLRFGEMERDALRGNTPISLHCGLSVKIEDMGEGGWKVLSWDKEKDGIVCSTQTEFLDKGYRECLEIMLEDGRKMYPSIRHPFLTSSNEWVIAQDIKPNMILKTNLEHPLMDIHNEIKECNNWSLNVGEMIFKTDTIQNYLKTLAFMRILGWLITDGHIVKDNYYGFIYLGHILDVESMLEDIKLVFGITRSYKFVQERYYEISLHSPIIKNILSLEGIIRGNKMTQIPTIPQFLLDKQCPRYIIREFLGGIFGADGHTCCLINHRSKRDLLTSVNISKSIQYHLIESLMEYFKNFEYLLNKCNIHNIIIQQPKETTSSKKRSENKMYSVTLHIELSDLLTFHSQIGFRHCLHKSMRLEAAVSYIRLRETVKRQHNWIVHRVDELTKFSEIKKLNPNKKIPTKKAIIQAVKELKIEEGLIHEYAIPSTHDITDHLIKGTSFGKFTSSAFPTAEEYMKKIDAFNWFISNENICYGTRRQDDFLRTMNLKVISIKPIGIHKVYDIQVAETESFLANGIVAHNCMISHGVSRFLTERLFDMSDVFSVPICSDCGSMPHTYELCNVCNSLNIRKILIPYACKLLFQELMAMGIKINLFPDTHNI
jgi:DNA-directed RNA polymerase beta subunit